MWKLDSDLQFMPSEAPKQQLIIVLVNPLVDFDSDHHLAQLIEHKFKQLIIVLGLSVEGHNRSCM